MSDFQKYLKSQLEKITLEDAVQKEMTEYDLGNDVGLLIRETRNELGITQEELAKKTGISQSSISRIENGSSVPSLSTLKKIGDSIGKRVVINYEDSEGEVEDNGDTD